MDTTPPAEEKKGNFCRFNLLNASCHLKSGSDSSVFVLFFSFEDVKEEKEAPKPEEAAKLQNGDGSKEGVATVAAAASTASGVSEEKKKAKTRFMFNIADGGFTGMNTDRKLGQFQESVPNH